MEVQLEMFPELAEDYQLTEVEGYERLLDILSQAYNQSAHGKGKERHGNNLPWHEQPIGAIGRMVGPGFNAGQVIKKTQEALGMIERGEIEAAEREMLGAIVYAASIVMLIQK